MNNDFCPYESPLCISAFIEENEDDFKDWCTERNLNYERPSGDTEIKFCQAHATRFDNFSWNWQESWLEESRGPASEEESLR